MEKLLRTLQPDVNVNGAGSFLLIGGIHADAFRACDNTTKFRAIARCDHRRSNCGCAKQQTSARRRPRGRKTAAKNAWRTPRLWSAQFKLSKLTPDNAPAQPIAQCSRVSGGE